MKKLNRPSVASSNCYVAQPCNINIESEMNYATDNATASVKSLANSILSRNHTCNSHETILTQACNLGSEISTSELHELLGHDFSYYEDNPEEFEKIKQLINDRKKMKAGIVPDSYCYEAYCKSCGKIPLYSKGSFLGCPWCLLGGYDKIREKHK